MRLTLLDHPIQLVDRLPGDTAILASPAAIEIVDVTMSKQTGEVIVHYRIHEEYAAVVTNTGGCGGMSDVSN